MKLVESSNLRVSHTHAHMFDAYSLIIIVLTGVHDEKEESERKHRMGEREIESTISSDSIGAVAAAVQLSSF